MIWTILIIASYALTGIGIIDAAGAGYFSARKLLGLTKKQHRILGVVLAVLAGLVGTQLLPYLEGKYQNAIEEKQNTLSESINTLFIDPKKPFITIHCGGVPMDFPTKDIKNLTLAPFAITENGDFAFGEYGNTTSYKPITIKFKDGSLKIDAELRSHDQKIVARIHENDWLINKNNYYDRNYDESGLEIIDMYGITQLQINIIDGNQIYIGGTFFTENKLAILTYHRAILRDEEFSLNDIIKASKENITPIFQYPSSTYLGRRAIK